MLNINQIKYLAIPLIMLLLLFSKALADVFSTLIGLTFFAYSVKNSRWNWVKDPIVKTAFICWLFILLIVPVFSVTPMESLLKSFSWVRFILLYAVINYFIFNDKASIKKAALSLIAILTVVCINLIWEYSTAEHMARLTGFLDRPNIGMFCAKLGFATFALYYASLGFGAHRSKLEVIYVNVVALTLITMILVSGERSAALVMLFNFIVVIPLILFRIKQYRWFSFSIPLITIFLSLALYFTQPMVQHRIVNLKDDLSGFWTSNYGQLTTASIEIIKENPITGIGIKNFYDYCQNLLADGQVAYCTLHPHNIYIEWSVSAGLVGLTLFCLVVFNLFKTVLNKQKEGHILVTALACSGLMMTLFPFMFSQSFFSNWPALTSWLSVSVCIAAARQAQHS